MIAEIVLIILMFCSGYTSLGLILLGIMFFGFVCLAIAPEKDSKGTITLLFNIPIAFCYIYFGYLLFQLI